MQAFIQRKSSFVDFQKTLPFGNMAGWLEKKGSVNTAWKRRYFALVGGILKYYTIGPDSDGKVAASDVKGQIMLQGAAVDVYKDTRFNIRQADDKRVLCLKASSNEEMEQWLYALNQEIERSNIIALKNGSKMPEVIDWYYHKQAEVVHATRILDEKMQAVFTYNGPGRSGAVKNSAVVLQINSERNAIEITFELRKKLDAVENLLNGRLIEFKDVYGVDMDPANNTTHEKGAIPETVNNLFAFVLVTKEDVFQFRFTSEGGGPWLSAIMLTIAFMSIPPPSSRGGGATGGMGSGSMGGGLHGALSGSSTISPGRGNNSFSSQSSSGYGSNENAYALSSAANGSNIQIEFATVSGQMFHVSGDVQIFLQALINGAHKFNNLTVISSVALKFSDIFRCLSEVKCNKEVACQFGERMEDCVRVLADPTDGLLTIATPATHTNVIMQHMNSLSVKLHDCVDYLVGVSNIGWLPICLKPAGAANTKYKMMDLEVTSIVNMLIKAIGNPNLVFTDVPYEKGSDVRKSMLALGGAESIYKDTSKIRALAKLIQTTQSDLEEELRLIVLGESSSSNSNQSQSILHTISAVSGASLLGNSGSGNAAERYSRTSDARNSRNSRGTAASAANNGHGSGTSGSRGCFWRYFCCCFGSSRSSVSSNNRNDLRRKLI